MHNYAVDDWVIASNLGSGLRLAIDILGPQCPGELTHLVVAVLDLKLWVEGHDFHFGSKSADGAHDGDITLGALVDDVFNDEGSILAKIRICANGFVYL